MGSFTSRRIRACFDLVETTVLGRPSVDISQIEAAGGAAWEKIERYYVNLATWLTPARITRRCLHVHLLAGFYSHPGIEEYRPGADVLELGKSLRHALTKYYGPCWVTQFTFDWLGQFDVQLRERLIERYLVVPTSQRPIPPRPSPCLTCPPPELFEAAVLGGAVHAMAELVRSKPGGLDDSLKRLTALEPAQIITRLLEGSAQGVKELSKLYSQAQKQTTKLFG